MKERGRMGLLLLENKIQRNATPCASHFLCSNTQKRSALATARERPLSALNNPGQKCIMYTSACLPPQFPSHFSSLHQVTWIRKPLSSSAKPWPTNWFEVFVCVCFFKTDQFPRTVVSVNCKWGVRRKTRPLFQRTDARRRWQEGERAINWDLSRMKLP